MTWPFGNLRPFSYDVIVIDPPWDFENYSAAGTKKGADPHYDVMTLGDIKALPVGGLVEALEVAKDGGIVGRLYRLQLPVAVGQEYRDDCVCRLIGELSLQQGQDADGLAFIEPVFRGCGASALRSLSHRIPRMQ
jgi:hypothetical protein